MIDHVTIHVNDLDQSRSFYERAFIPRQSTLTPVHVAFRVLDAETIDAFFKAAIGAGAKSNGAPGFRPQYTKAYYACFVIDPDGHNIEAMCKKIHE